MTHHYQDLSSASDWLKRAGTSFQPIRSTTKTWIVISMEFLRSLLRRRFARAQVATSRNVGCFLRLKLLQLVKFLGRNERNFFRKIRSFPTLMIRHQYRTVLNRAIRAGCSGEVKRFVQTPLDLQKISDTTRTRTFSVEFHKGFLVKILKLKG